MKVCLTQIKDNMYEIIDCKTKEPIDLGAKAREKRAKRAPSAYNIHMGQCVKSKTGPIKDRFRSCAAEWKEKKNG